MVVSSEYARWEARGFAYRHAGIWVRGNERGDGSARNKENIPSLPTVNMKLS